MRTLHLTIKKEWFDMIASGEKKEEYREIKKYWADRLCVSRNLLDGCRDFYAIEFKNGYSKKARTLVVKCDGIDFGTGKPEWGAEAGKEYFVIKLGKNIKPFGV